MVKHLGPKPLKVRIKTDMVVVGKEENLYNRVISATIRNKTNEGKWLVNEDATVSRVVMVCILGYKLEVLALDLNENNMGIRNHFVIDRDDNNFIICKIDNVGIILDKDTYTLQEQKSEIFSKIGAKTPHAVIGVCNLTVRINRFTGEIKSESKTFIKSQNDRQCLSRQGLECLNDEERSSLEGLDINFGIFTIDASATKIG